MKLWNILNVKNTTKGLLLNDAKVIDNVNDAKVIVSPNTKIYDITLTTTQVQAAIKQSKNNNS